ncbi:MAG: helix-turn-helix domain-containing protein [Candidatus Atribacteria bacterium]|nr:helix-turn-helix domain-containing protein [Candidatus Atribacteria bacterium]
MKEIGEYLKNKRLELGISLDEAEQYLKIRKKYLIAIEEGDESALPGKVYFIGYLRNYANYLTIDQDVIDQILGKNEKEVVNAVSVNEAIPQKKKIGKYYAVHKRSRYAKKERKPINFVPLIKVTIIIFVILGVYLLINQLLNRPKKIPIPVTQREELTMNQPVETDDEKNIEQELTKIAEENIRKEEELTASNTTLLPPLPEYEPVLVTSTEPTWIKVMQGEDLLFETILFSMEKILLKSEGEMILATTNSDAIRVLYNDQIIEPQPSENDHISYYQLNHS